MSLHHEISFEDEVCAHLAAHGWRHAADDASRYDRARALFPSDLIEWVKETQPKSWDALSAMHGASAEGVLLDRARGQIDDRGTLEVLRHGIELHPAKGKIALAQFKPALAMNPETLARYSANRLRVVRQIRYSLHNENCLDLVLFLNGIPIATVELKTDFTQCVEDAIDQYRLDRLPRHKGHGPEPLLGFPNGALVHFAVSNSEVHMTTQLAGPETRFLPFNKGDGGGKGNPLNAAGHRTSYLWEAIWQRESWLEILGRYIIAQRDKKNRLAKVIFPRFHQLEVTRKLVAAVLAEGPGKKYLIQHSAGSGKTNSIAWTAHFLADLHDADNEKLFSTVIVVSDRNVIDAQLQGAIFDFQRTTGVVATITNKESSKSGALAEALGQGKKIIVCTIQTFPFALTAVRELAATEGKRFAVIADEAHSSQTGEAAAKLKEVLPADELAELEDGGEVSTEDILAAQMSVRASETGVSYFAFTATPKAKTLELFGRRPNPDLAAGPENLPAPFHVYSMRQAIEEGFILDVLRNYTPYKLAFSLTNDGKEIDEKEVDRNAALKGIMRWVRLHAYNISQKVQIVVEHYRANVAPLLDGKAKAMVVLGSRLEAVRWKLAIDKYIRDQQYGIGTLVAFSGEVDDRESGPDSFTETSKELNPTLRGQDIRDAFKSDEHHILLVANKFQTGFDEPLLCGMYVDRRLAGIQAVQTLSRLNRAHPGKDTTYVLDFVNSEEEVLKAFRQYHSTAELSGVTDPNLIYDLRSKLDASGYYDDFEVERVVVAELAGDGKRLQSALMAAVDPVVDRLKKKYKAAQERLKLAREANDAKAEKEAQDELDALTLFKRDIATFIRVYSFLSQMFDYGSTDIEKRSIFFKRLLPLLEFGREREGIDLSKLKLIRHKLKNQGQHNIAVAGGEKGLLQPLTDTGSGEVQQPGMAWLSEIIQKLNDLFVGDLTDDDQLIYVNGVLKGKMLESDVLMEQAANNSKEQFAASPDFNSELMDAIMDALEAHTIMSNQALNSERVREGLKDILLGPAGLYEALRLKQAGAADHRSAEGAP